MPILFAIACAVSLGQAQGVAMEHVADDAPAGHVEIRGVAAGAFSPVDWEENRFNLLPDRRTPLLEPLPGRFRNIYAPSVVETAGGWRLFYGAWDGLDEGHDRIYCVDTADWLSFGERRTVIHNGAFHHVCNVNVLRLEDGSFEMACTAYPDRQGQNKPAFFTSPDGEVWNGSRMPYQARHEDMVTIEGYTDYANADINGMNVLLREGEDLRLYFCDFRSLGEVYRATRVSCRTFRYEGVALNADLIVNDVAKFRRGGRDWYLMGLHRNTAGIWHTVSNDGLDFPEPRQLLSPLGEEDRYIVAVGWVTAGDRVLGVLYGAGAAPSLDRNRIFARWLQRKVVFITEEGVRCEPLQAHGPDRQHIAVPGSGPVRGVFHVFAQDGERLLGDPIPATVTPGETWQLMLDQD